MPPPSRPYPAIPPIPPIPPPPPSPAPGSAATLRVFLADLHLDGQDTPRARAFRALLGRLSSEAARRPVELYVLGDLFEFWDEYHRAAMEGYEADLAALEAAHTSGVRINLLWGNRDFMLGPRAQRRFGARLLGDGARVRIGDSRWLWLEHGDLLCTADRRYLYFLRPLVRSWPVRLAYRLLPWRIARRVVMWLAARSRAECDVKAPETFAPDAEAARKRLESAACQVLLCGHTHRAQAADLGGGLRLLALPPWRDTQEGYREQAGALTPIRVQEDGTPAPAAGAEAE